MFLKMGSDVTDKNIIQKIILENQELVEQVDWQIA